MNRRQFLKTSAGAGLFLSANRRYAYGQSPNVMKYVAQLPIPPAIDLTGGNTPGSPQIITMAPGTHKFHPLLGASPVIGYAPGNVAAAGYLGPTLVVKKGVPVSIRWLNKLAPGAHPCEAAIDTTVSNAPSPTDGRVVPHLHGGFSLPQFDGHPHQWWTPSFAGFPSKGSYFVSDLYTFGNDQDAAGIWYHDHAYGMTRHNVYAGLAAGYLIRDAYDTGDEVTGGLNGLKLPSGQYEVPLIIQDKSFNPNGTMFYPTLGITAVHPVWVPEFFGDVPVVNGMAYPFLRVAPRRYRLRIYNGSQARFYNMWFDNGVNPVPFHQIGTDQGLLPSAVPLTRLLLAPGERADVIFDFTGMANGTILALKNNAKSPYPGGRGGLINQIMQFRVDLPAAADPTTPPAQMAGKLPPFTPLVPAGSTVYPNPREIVLGENLDPVTGNPIEMLLNDKKLEDPVDEKPRRGSTEVWQFINVTVDAHPMHMHLVKFHIVNRQAINAKAFDAAWLAYNAGLGPRPLLQNYLAGAPIPPAPNEVGWKDTAVAMPGQVLRVAAKFDLPSGTVVPPAPPAALLPGEGPLPTGPQYVYHCHILEHEENDMMRPFDVV